MEFPFEIRSVASTISQPISIDEWAQECQMPNRKIPGEFLSGSEISRISQKLEPRKVSRPFRSDRNDSQSNNSKRLDG